MRRPVRTAVDHLDVDTGMRNVLVAHQFVTGAVRCESEEVSVGGLDQVGVSVFDSFDYVALGHIHVSPACGTGDGALLRNAAEVFILRGVAGEVSDCGGAF